MSETINPEPHSTEERLARALLTIAEVTAAVEKIERYLETNGEYLSIDAKVPMRAQTKAMRAALNKWQEQR